MGRVLTTISTLTSSFHRVMRRAVAPLLCAASTVSCLISPPEPLEEEKQVAPYVLTSLVTPSPFAYVVTKSTGQPQTFRVEFVSEDLGETVVGKLYTNVDTNEFAINNSGFTGPGSLSDPEPRAIELEWRNSDSAPAGCYVFTMTITHESNYSNLQPPEPIDSSKTAYVSWWVVHDMEPNELTFDQCPQPAPSL